VPEEDEHSSVQFLRELQGEDSLLAQRAFAALWERYSSIPFRLLIKAVHSRVQAEDLMQEVAVRAWARLRRPPKLNFASETDFERYLCVIAHHIASTYWSDVKRLGQQGGIEESLDDKDLHANTAAHIAIEARHDEIEEETIHRQIMDLVPERYRNHMVMPDNTLPVRFLVGADASTVHGSSMIIEALATLSSRLRDCLILHGYFNLPYQHIAEVLQISTSSVGWYVFEGKNQLRTALITLWAAEDRSWREISGNLNITEEAAQELLLKRSRKREKVAANHG
jgi:DNA-directed RNA polymerase specialized sigma24 family protein